MTRKLIAAAFFVIGSLSAQISVRIGPPPPPRVMVRPVAPGPGYIWVDGYWYPNGGRYQWHQGYWTRPPYEGSQWMGPRYEHDQFMNGYWSGDRGRIDHDHRWDNDRDRDWHHDRDDRNRDRDDRNRDRDRDDRR